MSAVKDCIACLAEIVGDKKYLTCSVCQNGYHLDLSCAGVAETSFAGMGQAKREKWRCKTCRTQDNRGGSQSAATSSQNTPLHCQTGVSTQLQSFGEKLDVLLAMKASVDTLLSLPAKVDELLTLKPTVERLEAHMLEMETKVDGLSVKYNTVLEGTTKNESKIKEQEGEHDELRETVNRQAETIQHLRDEINNVEQYSRLSNLEIHGLPTLPGENLKQRITDLATELGLPNFDVKDILTAHRLRAKPGLVP